VILLISKKSSFRSSVLFKTMTSRFTSFLFIVHWLGGVLVLPTISLAAPEIVVEQPTGSPISTTVMTGFGRSFDGLFGRLAEEVHLLSPHANGNRVNAIRNNGAVVAVNVPSNVPIVSDGIQYEASFSF
jgi:hypothetical protein